MSVSRLEESNCSYSPALCHDRSSEDIEGDENVVLNHNNNILSYMEAENENSVSVDNEDNNNNDEINGVVPPIIQNSPSYPPIKRGSSSKSVPTFNDSSDGNADNSRYLVYAESMDVDPPSIIRVVCRNITSKRAKGTIGVRIITATRGASNLMIGELGAWMIMFWLKQMQIKTPPLM